MSSKVAPTKTTTPRADRPRKPKAAVPAAAAAAPTADAAAAAPAAPVAAPSATPASPLALSDVDAMRMLSAGVHLGSKNLDPAMARYVYKRRPDGVHLIDIRKTWEKLVLAARVIVAIQQQNQNDVAVISARSYGQRATLKFAKYTGSTALAGRFTPGTFTNQIQANFTEPRLLIVTDPSADHQAVLEASYVNMPVVAFAQCDNAINGVDIVIPCNNRGKQAIGLLWYLLAREVQFMRGSLSRQSGWDVKPDLFFFRDPEEIEAQEEEAKRQRELAAAQQAALATGLVAADLAAPVDAGQDWQGANQDWDGSAPQAAPAGDFAAAPVA